MMFPELLVFSVGNISGAGNLTGSRKYGRCALITVVVLILRIPSMFILDGIAQVPYSLDSYPALRK